MAEPVTTTAVAGGTVTSVAFGAFLAGLPADVVLGAFAGAIFFVATASDYGIGSRLTLGLGSFIVGIIAYQPIAGLIIEKLPMNYNRGADAAGALISSFCAVTALMAFNKFLKKKWGGNNDNA